MIECCRYCHDTADSARAEGETVSPEWICCKLWHHENEYRPSSRQASPLNS
jgi:hypothetical protein